MKIDILGSNGQLGSEMRVLSLSHPEYVFIFSDIEDLDISSASELESHFEIEKPDVVVNCAAYTQVEKAEREKEKADKINRYAVKLLAEYSKKYSFVLFHISTDYVFDGNAFQPYKEGDITSPASVYGFTKLEGEKAIYENSERAVIIRTSWLYSSFGNNFAKTMIHLAKERKEIKVVFDQVGTPTYAADLAVAILTFMPKIKEIKGINLYHFSNEGVCSWYDFAREIIASVSKECKVLPVESSEYPTSVKRPFYSVLNKKKIKNELNMDIPHWKDALERCLKKIG